MRVVSLLPSATEMLYALDIEPVGVSHECDYPPEAQQLPTVVQSEIDPSASTASINEQVHNAESAGGVYTINYDMLADLAPDTIVSQGICDVCAVDDSYIHTAVNQLGLDAEIITTDPHSLSEVIADIERLGKYFGRDEEATNVANALRTRITQVREKTPPAQNGPDVTVLDWMDPIMTAGHWVPDIIEIAGATCPINSRDGPSMPRQWETLQNQDPDIIIVAPCGFEIDQTVDNAQDLASRPGWNDLTAVQTDRVYIVDGHHYLNRPGPRLIDSLEIVAQLIHSKIDIQSIDSTTTVPWPTGA